MIFKFFIYDDDIYNNGKCSESSKTNLYFNESDIKTYINRLFYSLDLNYNRPPNNIINIPDDLMFQMSIDGVVDNSICTYDYKRKKIVFSSSEYIAENVLCYGKNYSDSVECGRDTSCFSFKHKEKIEINFYYYIVPDEFINELSLFLDPIVEKYLKDNFLKCSIVYDKYYVLQNIADLYEENTNKRIKHKDLLKSNFFNVITLTDFKKEDEFNTNLINKLKQISRNDLLFLKNAFENDKIYEYLSVYHTNALENYKSFILLCDKHRILEEKYNELKYTEDF